MRIPVNVIFSPSWWNRHYGIQFDEPFYLDPRRRIENDVTMRSELFERFGLGQPPFQPRPVIGSMHIAGGFVMPALLGVPIRFSKDQAAWPVPRNLDRESVMALRAPEIGRTWPMDELIRQADALEKEFGCLVGDFNTAGIFNTSVEVRGNDLFTDLMEDPELTDHLFRIVSEAMIQVGGYWRNRTGTTSVSVNCSIAAVDPGIHLTSNCSVSMISPALYEKRILTYEKRLAENLQPFGIHHCGSNLQLYAAQYSRMPIRFLDVGSGSDVARCSSLFPQAFLNLRMNPVHLLQHSADDIYVAVQEMLGACGRTRDVGVCCINMDGQTPDENVKALFQAVRDFEARAEPTGSSRR
jgi:hypothetical protein